MSSWRSSPRGGARREGCVVVAAAGVKTAAHVPWDHRCVDCIFSGDLRRKVGVLCGRLLSQEEDLGQHRVEVAVLVVVRQPGDHDKPFGSVGDPPLFCWQVGLHCRSRRDNDVVRRFVKAAHGLVPLDEV